MKARTAIWLALLVLAGAGARTAAADTAWMQPGVRVWYLGAVDGGGITSSNAEEAYLIESLAGANASVVHHSALTHWQSPRPVETTTYPVTGMGPCWIHPQVLQTLQPGQTWMGWQITTVGVAQVFPYQLLPAKALLALNPQRQIVKLSYIIPYSSTGNAYFDAETGLLLYHHALWGANKMFFILAEINYDFARRAAFAEDGGPHTGFRSFVSEQSLGNGQGTGGGSIVIQSLVETRYGPSVEARVLTSRTPARWPDTGMADENYVFFGAVPIVRRLDATQAPNLPPEQWNPFGQYLWWWLPSTVTGRLSSTQSPAASSINVFDVVMAKTTDQPLTYVATSTPQRFHFTVLRFGNDGYLTEFSARDPASRLEVKPGDFLFQNLTRVDGPTYYRTSMALPAPGITSIFPAAGPTTGGVTITITGQNFTAGGTTVTIGGIPATDVSVSSTTSVTCTVPAGTAGSRDVIVTTMSGSAVVPGAFQYFDAASVTAPADPRQPVTVSVGVPGGAVTATLDGVSSSGWLMVVPVGSPSIPVAQVTVLQNASFLVSTGTVTYTSATICFPYSESAVIAGALTEDLLMVWRQPPGSASWEDVTASLDPVANRICALNGDSLVAIVGVTPDPLGQFRYLAEGATGGLFETQIALANPTTLASVATLRFLDRAGRLVRRGVYLLPMSRATVNVSAVPGMADAEFSTIIESNASLVEDRTMWWPRGGAEPGYGMHSERAVVSPAPTGYLAEGATHSGFDLFYLLQNPGDVDAAVEVRYLRPAPYGPLTKQYSVKPRSRFNIWVNLEDPALAATDVSAVITSTNGVPIIVERAMYLTGQGRLFNAGHESAGVNDAALEWFLAEGATGPYFDLFILIANPNAGAASVEARYLLSDGTVHTKQYAVDAWSRFNIWVDIEEIPARSGRYPLADVAVSTTVRSTNGVPIIVERAMWWPGSAAGWFEAHNSPGSTETGTRWAMAAGEVGGAAQYDTFILMANTSSFPGQADVTLLFEDGTTATRSYALRANSRANAWIKVDFAQASGKRFGAIVESVAAPGAADPAQIVVERAIYANAGGVSWAAGTNALATKLQ